MDTLVMAQIIVDPTVTLIRALCMDTLDFLCQRLILNCPAAELACGPLVVSRTGDMEQLAPQLYGTAVFPVALFDSTVETSLPYF